MKKNHSRFYQRSLWLSGVVCLGSMGGLNPNFASAQTAVDLVVPVEVQPAADPVPVAPEPLPVEVPAAPIAAPEVSSELSQTAPAPVEPSAAESAIDSIGSAPAAPEVPVLVTPNLADTAAAAFDQTGNYIDPTAYSVGATQPEVILSERSTGCRVVLQPGQSAPGSICPPAAASATTQYASSGGSYGGRSGGNWRAVSLDYSTGGRTTPSGREFYNLNVRPTMQLRLGNVSLRFPLSIPAVITSAFGWRIHPVTGQGRLHSGTDLGAPMGTPVLAAFSGKVEAADEMGGYGLAIILQHAEDTQTLYAHLSEMFVKPGEEVQQGQVIGLVGSTGMSTGPHLHFEYLKKTPDGWTAMDAGSALEYSLAQFVKSLQVAQANGRNRPAAN
ncbi:M23 family metallopeptidase [Leptolyngbya ohadii]|uniref:M23 family metallopeptidase n=1 Tax=Leptolyngbya ohadii TaxID=1962290 RepID=UPI001CED1C3D|nr:M23 family metallopeptidase [Leptolyngbya ohadii]